MKKGERCRRCGSTVATAGCVVSCEKREPGNVGVALGALLMMVLLGTAGWMFDDVPGLSAL